MQQIAAAKRAQQFQTFRKTSNVCFVQKTELTIPSAPYFASFSRFMITSLYFSVQATQKIRATSSLLTWPISTALKKNKFLDFTRILRVKLHGYAL